MKKWKEFEYLIAGILEGSRQAGSGLSPIASKKGDVKTNTFLVECKTTSNTAYLLTGKTLQKIVEQALNAQKIPLIAIQSSNNFFLSLEADDVEPKDMAIKHSQEHSPCFSVSSLSVPKNTVVKTHIKLNKQNEKVTYPVCIWQFSENDEKTFPREV